MGTVHVAMILMCMYMAHICACLCTVQRHAVGVQILSLLYWNVFFFFFFLLCQRACITDLLLYKYVVSRLRGNRWLFWIYKCQNGSTVHLFQRERLSGPGTGPSEMPHREGGIQTASVNTKFIPFTDKLEARTLESHRFSTEGTHNTDPGLPPMIVILRAAGLVPHK